ncbi:unnamed protein product, partial [Phaeothamnion confervicola]
MHCVRRVRLNGFVGGTVGVIGTILSIEAKKQKVKERVSCPYCQGSGNIVCGSCCGSGTLSIRNVVSGAQITMSCPVCSGRTCIVCAICHGDGRSVPF